MPEVKRHKVRLPIYVTYYVVGHNPEEVVAQVYNDFYDEMSTAITKHGLFANMTEYTVNDSNPEEITEVME